MKPIHLTLYGNGSSGNHGCEAIVRGTVSLLGEGPQYSILSENIADDETYGLASMVKILPARSTYKGVIDFLRAYLKLKMHGDYAAMDSLVYLPAIKCQKNHTDIALSVGGDNYCYGGSAGLYAYLNRAYHSKGIKTVLWGCSVEPEVVQSPEVAKDLALYNMIVARESITYEAIKKVQPNTIFAPDPAFSMPSESCLIDKRLENGNVIGINISPMIVSNEKVSGMAYENYKQLISFILKNTDAIIVLIPHVVWESNDDRNVLRQLYEDFGCDERIVLVEDHPAPQLKYIISKCCFFIGARTHATIAAYSSCVPTLVVGYSVKARGIARDLFGSEDGYVISVQNLSSPNQLTDAFRKMWSERDSVRIHLEYMMPSYIARSCCIDQLLKGVAYER